MFRMEWLIPIKSVGGKRRCKIWTSGPFCGTSATQHYHLCPLKNTIHLSVQTLAIILSNVNAYKAGNCNCNGTNYEVKMVRERDWKLILVSCENKNNTRLAQKNACSIISIQLMIGGKEVIIIYLNYFVSHVNIAVVVILWDCIDCLYAKILTIVLLFACCLAHNNSWIKRN